LLRQTEGVPLSKIHDTKRWSPTHLEKMIGMLDMGYPMRARWMWNPDINSSSKCKINK
jgi:hypothetical protein